MTKTKNKVKHCTLDDIGINITGDDKQAAQEVIDCCNKYLHDFCATTCPECGSKLGGLLGSFSFGLAWGEGRCTGGLSGKKCGWPCRAYHEIKDGSGDNIFEKSLPIVLAYHPDCVKTKITP